MKSLNLAALVTFVVSISASVFARDNVSIVGSSTVYPFSTLVAEKFGKTTSFKTPTVESTGSGGGIKLFCAGNGELYPDITNTSRRMKISEFKSCIAKEIHVVEVLIGFDGIVIANSKKTEQLTLSRRDLFLALAKNIPNPDGSKTLIANPYTTWKEVSLELPATKIEVFGPPPTSGTRDAFAELVMEEGCSSFNWIKALEESDKKKYKITCHSVREDGVYIESGENDNLIVQKLTKNLSALGIFGFTFLQENSSRVQGSLIEGSAPTFVTITNKKYPIFRPLYFYIKKNHIGFIPGLKEYVDEFIKERTWGIDGYLAERGMISLSDKLRNKFSKNAENLIILTEADFSQ